MNDNKSIFSSHKAWIPSEIDFYVKTMIEKSCNCIPETLDFHVITDANLKLSANISER